METIEIYWNVMSPPPQKKTIFSNNKPVFLNMELTFNKKMSGKNFLDLPLNFPNFLVKF